MAATKPAVKPEPKVPNLIPVYLQLLPEEGGVAEVDQRVVITVNGENCILPRGRRIEVTPEQYEILKNSLRFENL